MLDYISWYLVELKLRLKGHPHSLNLVAEVRAHLEEATHELETRGVDRAEATREVVRAFGDPATVASALRRSSSLGGRSYWLWSLIVALLLTTLWVTGALQMFGFYSGYPSKWPIYTFATGLATLALLAFRRNVWLAPGVLAMTALLVIAVISWTAAVARPVSVPGQMTMVAFSASDKQISLRQQWLRDAEQEAKELSSWVSAGSKGIPPGYKDPQRGVLAPYRSAGHYWGPGNLKRAYSPWHANQQWLRLGPETFGSFSLTWYEPGPGVEDFWAKSGTDYLNFLKSHPKQVQFEIDQLARASTMSYGQRWMYTAQAGGTMFGIVTVLVLVINGAILGLIAGNRWVRLHAWRSRIA